MEVEEQLLASPNDYNWHLLSPDQAIRSLDSDLETGLTSQEAKLRRGKFGPNELDAADQRTALKIFLAQLQSSLVALLAAAMVVSLVLGEVNDAIAVFAIIVLNTLLGFWQDYRAEKSMAELKKLSVPEVVVRRDGDIDNIRSAELVPGDVVMLRAGYFVPADCRVLESSDCAIDESALTGESLPVEKTTIALERAEPAIGDRTNLAYMGTMVVRGRAEAVVTSTGMRTELGEIAGSLQTVETASTPLQIRLGQLSRTLAVVAILVVGFVFLAGLVAGQDARLMLMTALSLAVAIVPEGLPAVATVALAVGARRMFKQNALIRRLPAVETLGSVTVICSDKTGTLTQNIMTATILDVADCRCMVNSDEDCSHLAAQQLLLIGGCLCNDAQLQREDDDRDVTRDGRGKIQNRVAVGEPTEKALVEVASKFGLDQDDLQTVFPRIGEIAFDSQRKRMTTLHSIGEKNGTELDTLPSELWTFERIAFAKGAVESILEESRFVWVGDEPVPLTEEWFAKIEQSRNEMAAEGTRVLAIAFRPVDENESISELEKEMVFVGMVGLTDPPRPEAKSAVERCRSAGIRPIMITGDHPLTAMRIAQQLGIADGKSVITGPELNEMSLETLRDRVSDVSVFARVAPSDKLHIVEALQDNDDVVAMTGDGVNDAPALKQANIGVSMGQSGTDVAKEAANMILLDDNFATIVAAVEQGRIVYDNVRKFVKYTMSSNLGEVLVMTLGVMMGMPLPLLPLQILWINLVTDGLPGLALAVEPAEKNTMNRAPIQSDESIFNRRMTRDVIWIGLLIGIVSLVMGGILGNSHSNLDHWRTVIFTALTFSQMGNALACRSDHAGLWRAGSRTNPWLWAAIVLTFLLQLAVIYVPVLQNVFHTSPLSLFELAVCLGVGAVVLVLIDTQKRFR